jgi:hypothetical protein
MIYNYYFECGLDEGYPSCCINFFIWLIAHGMLPALYMSYIYRIKHGHGFVLCPKCYENIIHEIEINGSFDYPIYHKEYQFLFRIWHVK